MNQPVLGVSREDTGKFILGTVPVEPDGSAHFRAPSGVSVFFQALDRNGLAVQTMRSLTYLQPGQTLSCVGCHESRDSTPPSGHQAQALLRAASKLAPEPTGTWPLSYDELVQPVLDRYCLDCHQPGAAAAAASAIDLTRGNSYDALINYAGKDLHNLVFERDFSAAGDGPSTNSKLYARLTDADGHEGVLLDAESRYRLAVWMDTYAQRQGAFSPQQEEELRQLRQEMAGLFEP
jgi:hypothetical protein